MSVDWNSSFSKLTGARQTMLSWAKLIESFEAVPEIYKDSYQNLVGNSGVIPYTILAPAQGHVRGSKSKERLLFEIEDTLYVLERTGDRVAASGYCYPEINSLELGNILLYSWFSIHGRTINGTNAALTVEFNQVTLRYFEPFLRKIRPAFPDSSALKAEQAKFDYLVSTHYKFMNFARKSLVPGEKVIQSLYQPQKRQRLLTVLGRSLYRTIFQAHLTILTDKEIILIGETEDVAENEHNKYGGVRRFIPLTSLLATGLVEQPDGLLRFTLHVYPDIQVERRFDAAHLSEVEDLKKRLEHLLLPAVADKYD